MQIDYIQWDSDFFDLKIGSIQQKKAASPNNILDLTLEIAKVENYNLIYYFTDKDSVLEESLLARYNGKLVDRKIIYEGICKNTVQTGSVERYKSSEPDENLLKLAILSGEYSRFKLDSNFAFSDFERLYNNWIERSISKQIADEIFIVRDNQKIVGMVTLKIKGNVGVIGLIAVENSHQGHGLGKQLLDEVMNYLYTNGTLKLEVATQMGNVGACRFYTKNNLSVKSVTNIYHFWLQ